MITTPAYALQLKDTNESVSVFTYLVKVDAVLAAETWNDAHPERPVVVEERKLVLVLGVTDQHIALNTIALLNDLEKYIKVTRKQPVDGMHVSDEVRESIVREYLKTPEGRRKLVASLVQPVIMQERGYTPDPNENAEERIERIDWYFRMTDRIKRAANPGEDFTSGGEDSLEGLIQRLIVVRTRLQGAMVVTR
jgi:hypothetical protein